ALMVVWGYPCESKSSPAHYSNTPVSIESGVLLIARNKSGKLITNPLEIKFNSIYKEIMD
ncbi:hypothetical protein ACG9XY_14770, partial [Acinetobacter seifertii]|uniref:hypothetical protein n=1 Tax=Acinetobacter seifertii TaxID=1530123 RepID=UPI003AF78176